MGDNKYGEPWEALRHENIYDVDGDNKALFFEKNAVHRAVHCVNACAGMSDEEVGKVKEIREVIAPLTNALEREASENSDALKLLKRADEWLHYGVNVEEKCNLMVDISAFLNRKDTP